MDSVCESERERHKRSERDMDRERDMDTGTGTEEARLKSSHIPAGPGAGSAGTAGR